MTLAEAVGCLASGLVLLTFGMRTMAPMRLVAIASNLAFIAYGLLLEAPPIWVLHSVLLPLNVWRLLELQTATSRRERLRRRATRRTAARRPARQPHAPLL